MTRRLIYLLIAINLSLMMWAGILFGLITLANSNGDSIDPDPTASIR